MQASKALEAFKKFVKLEEELLQMLGMRVELDRKMLVEMGKQIDDYRSRENRENTIMQPFPNPTS